MLQHHNDQIAVTVTVQHTKEINDEEPPHSHLFADNLIVTGYIE